MDNRDVQHVADKMENEKISLIYLNDYTMKENNYPLYDYDLDDEFDVIRSIN